MRKFESLSVLAGGIVDDLNNLLTGIMGNIDLARMNLEPESKSHAMLSYAKEGCAGVRELIRQFLTFSKGSTPIREPARLNDFLRDAADEACSETHASCEFSMSEGLWPAAYDKRQMRQAIRHLLLNAGESMPSGGRIRVSAENVSIRPGHQEEPLSMDAGNYVRISVGDKGKGIREEDLGKIFDPYFSGKKTETRRGRGLGLTTVYAVVKKHHGYVDVASKPGKGTRVCIYLPAVSEQALSAILLPEERFVHPKGRILIMDDEALIIDVAASMVHQLGYDTEFAKNGREAVERYRVSMESGMPFEAVILELNVTDGMGGKAVMRELLKIDPDVKAILSGDYANDPEMTDFEKYGFGGAIEKPYSISDLSKALENMQVGKTVKISLEDLAEAKNRRSGNAF